MWMLHSQKSCCWALRRSPLWHWLAACACFASKGQKIHKWRRWHRWRWRMQGVVDERKCWAKNGGRHYAIMKGGRPRAEGRAVRSSAGALGLPMRGAQSEMEEE